MFALLTSILGSSPQKKLIKARDRRYKTALQFQRNGNLREYARIIAEISTIDQQLAEMDSPN